MRLGDKNLLVSRVAGISGRLSDVGVGSEASGESEARGARLFFRSFEASSGVYLTKLIVTRGRFPVPPQQNILSPPPARFPVEESIRIRRAILFNKLLDSIKCTRFNMFTEQAVFITLIIKSSHKNSNPFHTRNHCRLIFRLSSTAR